MNGRNSTSNSSSLIDDNRILTHTHSEPHLNNRSMVVVEVEVARAISIADDDDSKNAF